MAGDNTSLKVRFLHLSIFLFLLTIYSSNYTSIHLYICLSIYLFIYLSIYSICLSNLSFYSSIYLIHKHDSNIVCYPLSTHPFLYTFSPPPYLIHDSSSLFCLKCTLYSVHPSIYFLIRL